MATTQGTSVVWTSSGGTKVITLTSLADDGGRAGASHDFGADFPTRCIVTLELDFNVAPTAGERVDLFWASSIDGTNFDAEVTTADEAFTEANNVRLKLIGSLICTNDTDPQRTSWLFYLPARYGKPVIVNKSGQALTATGTDQKITVTPLTDS